MGTVTSPMSHLQRHWWTSERLLPNPGLVMRSFLRVSGELDPDALERAAADVVTRHESLRTTFARIDGNAVQLIHPTPRGPVTRCHDLRTVPAPRLRTSLAAMLGTPAFDLASGPLFRLDAVRLGHADWLLAVTLHHIIGDAWSMGVLWDELSRAYGSRVAGAGPDPCLEPPLQLREWTRRERETAETEWEDEEIAFWRGTLRGVRPINVPFDTEPSATTRHRPATYVFPVPSVDQHTLHTRAARLRSTPYILCVAAFVRLLAGRVERSDVATMTLLNRRGEPEVSSVIGCLMNHAVVSVRLPPDGGDEELLGSVRDAVLDVFDHQDTCAPRVWGRSGFRPASVDVMFTFDYSPLPGDSRTFGDHPARFDDGDDDNEGEKSRSATQSLKLHIQVGAREISGAIGYNANLYREDTIAQIATEYVGILERLVYSGR